MHEFESLNSFVENEFEEKNSCNRLGLNSRDVFKNKDSEKVFELTDLFDFNETFNANCVNEKSRTILSQQYLSKT
jgi:hypothetical protein